MANFWEESFYTKFNSDISLTKRMLNMSITIFVIFKIKINSRSENLNQYAAVHITQLILHALIQNIYILYVLFLPPKWQTIL